MAPFLRRLHGDTVLWVGSHSDSVTRVQNSMVRHVVYLEQQTGGAAKFEPRLAAKMEALPLRSNSLDGIVLHHALENTHDARIALREITRVLAPGGRLIICGFNPLSLIGMRRLYARFLADALSEQQLINPLRLFDWLTLLGFELDFQPTYAGFNLPIQSILDKLDNSFWRRRGNPGFVRSTIPFGAVIVVSATKQAASMRPSWNAQRGRRQLAPVAYPTVSSWRNSKS